MVDGLSGNNIRSPYMSIGSRTEFAYIAESTRYSQVGLGVLIALRKGEKECTENPLY